MSGNGRIAAWSVVLVVVLSWCLPVDASERLSRFTFSRKAMGVEFTIVLYASEKSQANRAARAALDRITSLDAVFSDYSETSELMRLCSRAVPGRAESASEDLVRILGRSQQLARMSRGAFDVTVGPLTKLWRRARRRKVLTPCRRVRVPRGRSLWSACHVGAGGDATGPGRHCQGIRRRSCHRDPGPPRHQAGDGRWQW